MDNEQSLEVGNWEWPQDIVNEQSLESDFWEWFQNYFIYLLAGCGVNFNNLTTDQVGYIKKAYKYFDITEKPTCKEFRKINKITRWKFYTRIPKGWRSLSWFYQSIQDINLDLEFISIEKESNLPRELAV